MDKKKPRLKFVEESAKQADPKARQPTKPKLLTDGDKAKARKEQLRFGKKETTAPIEPNTRSKGSILRKKGLPETAITSTVHKTASKTNY